MRLFGHPIHLMLVHFPTALFPFEFLCSAAGYFWLDKSFTSASFYAMTGGVILGFGAILFGTMDLLRVSKENPAAVKTAMWHGGVNTCVIMIYAILAYSQFKNYPDIKMDNPTILILKSAIIGFMFAANYLGGRLILKFRVAVEK